MQVGEVRLAPLAVLAGGGSAELAADVGRQYSFSKHSAACSYQPRPEGQQRCAAAEPAGDQV